MKSKTFVTWLYKIEEIAIFGEIQKYILFSAETYIIELTQQSGSIPRNACVACET